MTTTRPILCLSRLLRGLLAATLFVGGGLVAGGASPAYAAVLPTPVGVIVHLTAGETIDALNARHGTVTLRWIPALDAYLLWANDGRTAAELIVELLGDPGVAEAGANKTMRAPEVAFNGGIHRWTSAPATAAGAQWALAALNLPAAHAMSTGAGVTVAVIDTGVDSGHPLFSGALVAGYDFVDRDTTPGDTRNGIDENGNGVIDEAAGHGTHVAGIIRMVAPSAPIMPLRVLDSDGNADTFTLAEAMIWAADHGAKVVNVSMGQHGSSGLLKEASESLWRRGVIVVGAAGNEAEARTSFPAASKCAVSVTATTKTGSLAAFASYGTSVDTAAPGESIVSAFPFTPSSTATWSGTSMAAPFASAEAAMLIARRGDLPPGEIARLIIRHTVPIVGPTNGVRSGRINLVGALRAAPNVTTRTTSCLQ